MPGSKLPMVPSNEIMKPRSLILACTVAATLPGCEWDLSPISKKPFVPYELSHEQQLDYCR
jgi:hypothetical protein